MNGPLDQARRIKAHHVHLGHRCPEPGRPPDPLLQPRWRPRQVVVDDAFCALEVEPFGCNVGTDENGGRLLPRVRPEKPQYLVARPARHPDAGALADTPRRAVIANRPTKPRNGLARGRKDQRPPAITQHPGEQGRLGIILRSDIRQHRKQRADAYGVIGTELYTLAAVAHDRPQHGLLAAGTGPASQVVPAHRAA